MSSMDASSVRNKNYSHPAAGTSGSIPLVARGSAFPVAGGAGDLVGDAALYGSIPVPQPGMSISDYAGADAISLRQQYDFLELSYRGGPAYKDGRDGQGQPIMWRHDDMRESDEGFARRKRMAVYINHCKPIVNRFCAFIFAQKIARDTSDPRFTRWCRNVDLRGSDLHAFLHTAVKRACIFGRYYIGLDNNKPRNLQNLTLAQARELGVQMFLMHIDPRRVLAARTESGALTEALILYGDGTRAILWRTADLFRISLDPDGIVRHVEHDRHGWNVEGMPRLPIIQIAPFEGDSLIGDVAELARDATCMGSLLREDFYNACFSQRWLTGVTPEEFEETIQGSNRVICLPRPEAKIHTTGAAPGVSESLMKMIDADVRDIYRQVGLKAEDPLEVGQAKSGIALRVEFNDLAALLAAIGSAARVAETAIVGFWNANGADDGRGNVAPPDYPDEFGQPDLQAELDYSLTILEAGALPPAAKLLEAKRICRVAHPNASPEQLAKMDEQCEEMYGARPGPSQASDEVQRDLVEKVMGEILERFGDKAPGEPADEEGAGDDQGDAAPGDA